MCQKRPSTKKKRPSTKEKRPEWWLARRQRERGGVASPKGGLDICLSDPTPARFSF
jgi:hypothetical protein